MRKSRPEQRISVTAGEKLSRAQAVKFDANGQVVPVTAAANLVIGTVEDAVASGAVADIVICGIGRAVAAAAIDAGARVCPAAAGKVTTASAGSQILGVAMAKASAAGDEIDVLITPSTR